MLLNRLERFGPAVDHERVADARIEDRINEKRKPRDVVQVRVREQHVTDLAQGFERQVANARARIEQHVVVDEHR